MLECTSGVFRKHDKHKSQEKEVKKQRLSAEKRRKQPRGQEERGGKGRDKIRSRLFGFCPAPAGQKKRKSQLLQKTASKWPVTSSSYHQKGDENRTISTSLAPSANTSFCHHPKERTEEHTLHHYQNNGMFCREPWTVVRVRA